MNPNMNITKVKSLNYLSKIFYFLKLTDNTPQKVEISHPISKPCLQNVVCFIMKTLRANTMTDKPLRIQIAHANSLVSNLFDNKI